MTTGKCCYDCISCICCADPLRSGAKYLCIDPEGKKHFSDVWDIPCWHFKEEK